MNKASTLMKEQWQDIVSLLLALWLLASPWILQFQGTIPAMWNSVILGAIIAVASGAALVRFHEWEEWVDMIMELWLIVAPWVLGYSTMMAAAWNHVLVGLVTIGMAAWAIWHFRHQPHTTTTTTTG